MGSTKSVQQVLIILGATAVGKTETAIRVAERVGGEIISADSRLLYKGMDIGTAKPTLEERKRVKHHLIDLAEPDEVWSLALFQKELIHKIREISDAGRLPIVTGGTGQYIRSLVEGWVIPTVKPDFQLRAVLETWGREIGSEELHKKVALLDPEAARKIAPQNLRRLVRALEVILTSGELFSGQKEKAQQPLEFKLIGLTRPRFELYARVDARIEQMFDRGFEKEVRRLNSKGYSPDLPTLSAIGYREVIQVINGDISLEEAKQTMRRKTREFIRRQPHWFKPDDPLIEWFEMTPDPFEDIIRSVQTWWNRP
jgi:tRNA dimethylallyltransferase